MVETVETTTSTRKNANVEDPVIVAQRYFNIFRQMHIFGEDKKAEFNKELLTLTQDVRKALAGLPGGGLLLEYIDEELNGEEFSPTEYKALSNLNTASQETPSASSQAAMAPVINATGIAKLSVDDTFTTAISKAINESQEKLLEVIRQNPPELVLKSSGMLATGTENFSSQGFGELATVFRETQTEIAKMILDFAAAAEAQKNNANNIQINTAPLSPQGYGGVPQIDFDIKGLMQEQMSSLQEITKNHFQELGSTIALTIKQSQEMSSKTITEAIANLSKDNMDVLKGIINYKVAQTEPRSIDPVYAEQVFINPQRQETPDKPQIRITEPEPFFAKPIPRVEPAPVAEPAPVPEPVAQPAPIAQQAPAPEPVAAPKPIIPKPVFSPTPPQPKEETKQEPLFVLPADENTPKPENNKEADIDSFLDDFLLDDKDDAIFNDADFLTQYDEEDVSPKQNNQTDKKPQPQNAEPIANKQQPEKKEQNKKKNKKEKINFEKKEKSNKPFKSTINWAEVANETKTENTPQSKTPEPKIKEEPKEPETPVKDEFPITPQDTDWEFSDEENDSPLSDDSYEWEYVEDDSPEEASDEDYEWEYVEDDSPEQTASSDDDYEWEYVEEDGDFDPNGDYEWEYIEDDTPEEDTQK